MSIAHKTSVIALNLIKKDLTNKVSIAMIDDAIKIINEAEATEKRLQDLERDVKRYMELVEKIDYNEQNYSNFTMEEINEGTLLEKKLSKVGQSL
jgi:hypothetical protein